MLEETLNDSLFEAMFSHAVYDNFMQSLEEIPSENELNSNSRFFSYHKHCSIAMSINRL